MPLFAESRAQGATKTTRRLFRCPARGQPFGRPATVTSMPPPKSRLAARLASSSVIGVDQAAAPLDIVDAEIVDLDLHELGGDLAGRVERERVGALEDTTLRLRQFLMPSGPCRPCAVSCSMRPTLGRPIGAHRCAADEHGRGCRSQTRLAWTRRRQGRASRASRDRGARRNVPPPRIWLTTIGGDEIRIRARDAGRRQSDHGLRDVERDHYPSAEAAQASQAATGWSSALAGKRAERTIEQPPTVSASTSPTTATFKCSRAKTLPHIVASDRRR